ncbi:hypothetical protein J3459_007384 [Metarhizium acridum]|nr:hypothetical protein J3459_007384 [Metarhizium acridum]
MTTYQHRAKLTLWSNKVRTSGPGGGAMLATHACTHKLMSFLDLKHPTLIEGLLQVLTLRGGVVANYVYVAVPSSPALYWRPRQYVAPISIRLSNLATLSSSSEFATYQTAEFYTVFLSPT